MMQFTHEEKQKIKTMLLYLVKKQHNQSGGNCGFHVQDLEPIMEELEQDGEIKARRTIHSDRYFFKLK